MPKTFRSLPLLLLTTMTAACQDNATLAYCTAAAGEPVVISAGEGAWSQDRLSPQLTELWRAGGLREGQELVYPVGLTVSPEGRIAVADFDLAEVVVIEPDGRWLGPWGRRGDGPGELNTPAAVRWGADEVLAVFDLMASKVLFLQDGETAHDDVPVSRDIAAAVFRAGELPWVAVQPDGGIILQPPPSAQNQAGADGGRLDLLLYYAPGAEVPDTLIRSHAPASALVAGQIGAGWPAPRAALGPDGTIALADTAGHYRIEIRDSTGRPVRQICRNAPPLPLNAWERGDSLPEDVPPEWISAFRDASRPQTPAAIGRLIVGTDGRLWVQRDRSSFFHRDFLSVSGATYDVFDHDGEYLGSVEAPAGTHFQGARGDTVLAFATGTLDETEVVAYQLSLE